MGKHIFNPWLEIQGMKDKIDKILESTFHDAELDNGIQDQSAAWRPKADIYETSTHFVIQMELAGIPKNSITLEIKNHKLAVSGERRLEKDAQGAAYHSLERAYGPFCRTFVFPRNIEQKLITAEMENGLLTITAPKQQVQNTVKRIEITEE